MSQIAVRLTDAELAQLDSLVDDGAFRTRSEAVRAGIRLLSDMARERRIRSSYEAAYRQMPLTHDEVALLDAAASLATRVSPSSPSRA